METHLSSRHSLRLLGLIILLLQHVARAQSPAEDLLKQQQQWHIQCMEKGCMASVDILRGESGDPPDPKDADQYVSIAVGVDYQQRQPNVFIIQLDSQADKAAGIDLHFARTVPDGKSWKLILDELPPIHMDLRGCGQKACFAAIGGGNPDGAILQQCSDVVKRMQSGDHMFLIYQRAGHEYRTAVSLSLFKESYQKLLAEAAKPAPNK